MGSQGEEGGLFVSLGRSPLPDQESCKYGDGEGMDKCDGSIPCIIMSFHNNKLLIGSLRLHSSFLFVEAET